MELTPDQDKELRKALEPLQSLIGTVNELNTARRSVDNEVRKLAESLGEMADDIEQHCERMECECKSFRDAAIERLERLQEHLREVVDTGNQQVTELVEHCEERMLDLGETVSEEIIEPFQAKLAQSFEDLRERVVNELIDEQLTAAASELHGDAMEAAEKALDKGLEALAQCGSQVAQQISGDREHAAAEREGSQAATQEVENLMDPVQFAVDRVRDLAHMVGISI